MTGITKEFIQETKLIQIINNSYRKMKWTLAPKVIEEKYDEQGNEIHGLDNCPNLKAFNLILINNDIKNEWQIDALSKPLTKEEFQRICNDIFEDKIYNAIKEKYPNAEIDDETVSEDYIAIEEQKTIYIEAQYQAIKEIAERIVKRIKNGFQLRENDEIAVYVGSTLVIKSSPNINAKKLTYQAKEEMILNAKFLSFPQFFAVDLYTAIEEGDIKKINKKDLYVLELMQYAKNTIK